MKTVTATIKGLVPGLLMNRFSQEAIEGTSKKKVGAELAKDPADKLYVNAQGQIFTPATHIQGCLINAGKSFQIKGKKRSNYSKLFASMIDISPLEIVHKNQKYTVHETTGVNPNTGGRVLIKRPLLTDWELTFDIIIQEDSITPDVVKEALEFGGKYIGIGDWRPDKKGKFGKFEVTNFIVR